LTITNETEPRYTTSGSVSIRFRASQKMQPEVSALLAAVT
jgi:hypothetical protein